MSFKGLTVYTANAKTNKVDKWKCIGELNAVKNDNVKELLCFLIAGKKYVSLPKRCVFETKEAARAALKK